ncbi:MAG: DUF2059 domain-containing protein [Verrucomicrobiales bacterium]
MKKIIYCLLLSSCVITLAARAETPSLESIHKLLELTESRKMLDEFLPQMRALMEHARDETLAEVEDAQRAREFYDKTQDVMFEVMEEELSWDTMLEMYIPIYQETFTQEEIDGLIEFYESSVGQAFINKQPILMQNVMTQMQGKVGGLVEKLQERLEKLLEEELKENEADADAPKEAGS